MKFGRLLTLGALFGGLLFPSVGWSGDVYQAASNTYGAARFVAHVVGTNADSDTTEDTIWQGSDIGGPIRCFTAIGTTAVSMFISSDDPSDASDGAAPVTITVEALDANWNPVTIVQALGATVGATGSALTTQIGTTTLMRVNRAYVSSTVPALGNIYINDDNVDTGPDGVPDNILTSLVTTIAIGENQTLQACYSVPNNFTGFLTQSCTTTLINSSTDSSIVYRMRFAVNGGPSRTQDYYELHEPSVGDGGASTRCKQYSTPVPFAEMTDIELTAVSSAANAAAAGSFDLILIKNTSSGL